MASTSSGGYKQQFPNKACKHNLEYGCWNDGSVSIQPSLSASMRLTFYNQWLDLPVVSQTFSAGKRAKWLQGLVAQNRRTILLNKEATMPNHTEVAISLTAGAWKVLMNLVEEACQSKGEDWVKWGQELNQVIQASIDSAAREVPSKDSARTVIASGNLFSIGYEEKTKTLEIEFNDGSIYQYDQVPKEIYAGLMEAEFPVIYYSAMIQTTFPSKKIRQGTIDATSGVDEPEYYDLGFVKWVDAGEETY